MSLPLVFSTSYEEKIGHFTRLVVFFPFCLILIFKSDFNFYFIIIFHHEKTIWPTFYSISLFCCCWCCLFSFLAFLRKDRPGVGPARVGNPKLPLASFPQRTENQEELSCRFGYILKFPVPESGQFFFLIHSYGKPFIRFLPKL